MSSRQNSERRVVITGAGVISPVGIGVEPLWNALRTGRSGISRIDRIEYSALPGHVAGEVKEFTEAAARKVYLKKQRKSIKVMCRDIQLGVASASLALEHSGIDLAQVDRSLFGVEFGANQMLSPPVVLKDGCYACVEDEENVFRGGLWATSGMRVMEPLWLLKYLPNMPACHIGILADARGPNNSLTQSEASGNLALGEALRVIQRGSAQIMIAGTTGGRIHPTKCLHAALFGELACAEGPPSTWCRPFDRGRTGQVVGEGACSFLLEEETHAAERGADIMAIVLGAGSSCVSNRQGQADCRQALVNAMRVALSDAGLTSEDVGHVNANGLATRQADIDEAAAIHDVFGERAETVPVTALKSYFGNSGAACGALELAGSIVGLKHGLVPATLNYETPDAECALNVVHGEPQAAANNVCLNINVTDVGQASALVVQVC